MNHKLELAVVAAFALAVALPSSGQQPKTPAQADKPAAPAEAGSRPSAEAQRAAHDRAVAAQATEPAECVMLAALSPADAAADVWSSSAQFSVTDTVDLVLRARLMPDQTQESILTIEIRTPDHGLYRTITTPLGIGPGTPKAQALDSYPEPVLSAKGARPPTYPTFTNVDVTFPVAGTDIVANGLYGNWTASAWVGTARPACRVSPLFQLRP